MFSCYDGVNRSPAAEAQAHGLEGRSDRHTRVTLRCCVRASHDMHIYTNTQFTSYVLKSARVAFFETHQVCSRTSSWGWWYPRRTCRQQPGQKAQCFGQLGQNTLPVGWGESVYCQHSSQPHGKFVSCTSPHAMWPVHRGTLLRGLVRKIPMGQSETGKEAGKYSHRGLYALNRRGWIIV